MLDRGKAPLPGATITVLNHPEFGQTLSRTDGWFDLVVNGGGHLNLTYQKTGFLPAQRQVDAQWDSYAIADDVVLVPLDTQVTAVDLSTAEVQVAQGSAVTDNDGTRQATVVIPAGTSATMKLPDGSTRPLTMLHVRATEYTVGASGFDAMPGPLPPSSAYTYAVELSVDEAQAVGATRVDFNQPLPLYVDNFLNFPVGAIVPVGWYDREKAAWIPSDNGKIIKLLTVENGTVSIDSNGDGNVDDAATLTALGINEAERIRLASLYPAGKTLWRSPIKHFTPWDCNEWIRGQACMIEETHPLIQHIRDIIVERLVLKGKSVRWQCIK